MDDLTNIYILKLTDGKFYVGKTNNVDLRIQEHFNGIGCEWTKRYRPVEIDSILRQVSIFDEDKYTLMYMDRYGIDNVRGGIFSYPILYRDELNFIQKMIRNAKDQCLSCGQKGQFYRDCPQRKNNRFSNNRPGFSNPVYHKAIVPVPIPHPQIKVCVPVEIKKDVTTETPTESTIKVIIPNPVRSPMRSPILDDDNKILDEPMNSQVKIETQDVQSSQINTKSVESLKVETKHQLLGVTTSTNNSSEFFPQSFDESVKNSKLENSSTISIIPTISESVGSLITMGASYIKRSFKLC